MPNPFGKVVSAVKGAVGNLVGATTKLTGGTVNTTNTQTSFTQGLSQGSNVVSSITGSGSNTTSTSTGSRGGGGDRNKSFGGGSFTGSGGASDTDNFSITGQKIVDTGVMSLDKQKTNKGVDLTKISQDKAKQYAQYMAAANKGEVYQEPVKESTSGKTGYYFDQEGFQKGFVGSEGEFYPTENESFVPEGYTYQEPTEKITYDPETGKAKYVESAYFQQSMTGEEYDRKIQELQKQIEEEDIKLANAEKYGTSFGGGGNFNAPSYEEPKDLSAIEKLKSGSLAMAGLALGAAETFNPLGSYEKKNIEKAESNSANIFNIGYQSGYETTYKENPKLARGKQNFIEWAAPSGPKTLMNAPGASTGIVKATQQNINLATANRGDIKTWQSKDTGLGKQAAAGLVDFIVPTSFASLGKTSIVAAGLAGATYAAPLVTEVVGAGLGIKGAINYFKAPAFSPEKKTYAMDVFGLLTLPALAPRVIGEVNMFRRSLEAAKVLKKIPSKSDIPTTNIFVKAEKLIPPKALSGEQAYPLAPVEQHLTLFEQFSQRLPGQRPEVPKNIITADYAKYNLYKQLKEGAASTTPSGHGFPHAEAVAININKLINAYPEYNSYWIKKYGSIDEAKAQMSNAMWHDITKVVGSSKTDAFTIFGKKHGEAYYDLWKKGLLPAEAKVNKNIAQAVRVHETIAGTEKGTKSLIYRVNELFGRNSPEAKILSTADRLDLQRYGMKIDVNRLPLKDAIKRLNKIDNIFYHGTKSENVPSILEKGLLTPSKTGIDNYPIMSKVGGKLPDEISLTSSLEEAKRYSKGGEILKIKLSPSEIKAGEKFGYSELKIKGDISKEKIARLNEAFPELKITTPKFTPDMDLFIKNFEKKYVVSFDTGEVMPRSTAKPKGFHATGDMFWKGGITEIKPSASEIPGLYTAPWLSPKFLKIGTESEYSFLPKFDNILKGWKPAVLEITPKRFEVRQGIKVPEYSIGESKYTQMIPGKKEIGVSYITKVKTEVESITPTTLEVPGQGLQLTSQYGYSRFPTTTGNPLLDLLQGKGRFGRVVLIDTAETVDTNLVGNVKNNIAGTTAFTGKTIYRAPTPESFVIPIVSYKPSEKVKYTTTESYKPTAQYKAIPTYKPMVAYKPVAAYKPVMPYKSVAPYKPVTPYKPVAPYKPVTPYRPVTPYKPYVPYRPIAIPKYALGPSNVNRRNVRPQQAFNVEVKKRGVWVSQNVALTEKQAGLLAQKRLKLSLAASARLVPTKRRLQNAIVSFAPQKGEFRQYQIRGGRKISTPRMFIQEVGGKGKSFSRLGTRREVKEISIAKKSKGGFKW